MNLDIIRIHDTPMKLVLKDRYEVLGAFWYGDHFIRKESFTEEMRKLFEKYHAETLKERLDGSE